MSTAIRYICYKIRCQRPLYFPLQPREILHEQPVDEDVAPADFAEEDALSAVIEETNH